MQTEALSLDELVKKADAVAKGLHSVADGRPADALTQSNVGTFLTVATMIDALSKAATRPNPNAVRWERALHRIANLEVRGAARLLERQEWARIAIELQAIAQEGISGLNSH